MQEITYHVKLKVKYEDGMGYTTYVFENLDYTDEELHYIMCVRFPNWDNCSFEEEDVGYVNVRYVREGIDKWFDGKVFNAYNYTNVIFLKFIKEKSVIDIRDIKID